MRLGMKMKKFKYILLVVVLISIGAIGFLSFRQTHRETERKRMLDALNSEESAPSDSDAQAKLSEVRYTKMVRDFTEYVITAKKVDYFKDGDISKLEDVHVTFFTREGDEYDLRASNGAYDATKNEISLVGDVVLVSKGGYEVLADSLLYAHNSKVISTSDAVVIKKENRILKGTGMLFDLQSERIQLKQDVSAKIF